MDTGQQTRTLSEWKVLQREARQTRPAEGLAASHGDELRGREGEKPATERRQEHFRVRKPLTKGPQKCVQGTKMQASGQKKD